VLLSGLAPFTIRAIFSTAYQNVKGTKPFSEAFLQLFSKPHILAWVQLGPHGAEPDNHCDSRSNSI
jgi:hypothetical protein